MFANIALIYRNIAATTVKNIVQFLMVTTGDGQTADGTYGGAIRTNVRILS